MYNGASDNTINWSYFFIVNLFALTMENAIGFYNNHKLLFLINHYNDITTKAWFSICKALFLSWKKNQTTCPNII